MYANDDVNLRTPRTQEPEIPPGSPPETPPEEIPPGVPPGGPEEYPGQEPPLELPPGYPAEVPPEGPREIWRRRNGAVSTGHCGTLSKRSRPN
jgi:hypothetical protein